MEPTSAQDLFRGRHFDQEIIVLCVRWYLTFKLSSRDLVQMMAERGIAITHTTILRWVQRYVPEFEKYWSRYARPVGDSWRVDETYIKIKGQWVYLYRAVEKQGRTVDFLLSKRRDMAAAKRFFSLAVRNNGSPRVITLDGYAASHLAVAKLKAKVMSPRKVLSSMRQAKIDQVQRYEETIEALRRAEQKYRSIFENATEGNFSNDSGR